MKNLVLILSALMICTASFFLSSCNDTKGKETIAQQTTEQNLPELLKRNNAIGSAEEIEFVMTTYDNAVDAIGANPKNAKAHLKLAELFVLEARATGEHGHYYPAALQMIESVLGNEQATEDEQFRAQSLKASVQLSLHNFEEVLPIAEKAVEMNPHNAQIYGVLVDAYVELGDYAKAVEMSDKMISIRPDLRSYARVSYLREIHGDVTGAIEAMEQAVASGYPGYEDKAWAQVTLAELHKTYGNLEQAEKHFQIAMQERRDYPFAIAGLADVEMEKGNYEAAETLLEKACAIIPEFSFYEQLATLYQATGREGQAKETIEEILLMLEDDEANGHNMTMEFAALHLHYTGDYEKALEYAMKEYNIRPENIAVNGLLAQIYFEMNEQEKAANHIEKAMITNSKNPDWLALIDKVKTKTGKVIKEEEDNETALIGKSTAGIPTSAN